MPARPLPDRRLRHRGASIAVAMCLVLAACSGTDGISLQVHPATPTPQPTSLPTPSVAPTPSSSPEPTPTPVTVDPFQPRSTGTVVFEADGGLNRLDADAMSTPLEPGPEPIMVTIVGGDTVVGVDGRQLMRWDASGALVSTPCRCLGAAQLGGDIVALTHAGQLRFFSPALDPVSSVPTDLATVADVASLRIVGAAATGELIVVGERSAGSDDSFATWGIDGAGAVRLIGDGGGVGLPGTTALAPSGAVMAYTVSDEATGNSDECSGIERAFDMDLVTGVTVDRGPIWAPISDGSQHSERAVDLFWGGDVLYLVAEVAGGDDPDACASRWPTALWQHAGDGWTITDSGPVGALYPLSPSTKVYLLSENPDAPGDLIVETGGESARVASVATIVAARASQVDVDLTPAPRLTLAAAATHASLVVAAETGSAVNVAEAAGAGFVSGADSENGDAASDAVAYWEERGACCGLDIAAVVHQLLTTAPLTSFDDDGITVFEWRAPDPAGWRVAIDARGRTRWIIDAGP